MNGTALLERSYAFQRLGLAEPGDGERMRNVPIEAPVAIEYCGIGYAVMMATPVDLTAYAVGFTLAEGLIETADQIDGIDIHAAEGGWIVRVALPAERTDPVVARARNRISESGCGLCGIESIAQVLRPLPAVEARIVVAREAIAHALASLPDHQPLGRSTGAVHAAAFCTPDGRIVAACEDVGRHNALDKLVGKLAIEGIDATRGFMLVSARCSYELVEKAVRAGCPMLVAISAPTSLAVERAREAGLTLIALARADCALIASEPHEALA